MKQCLLSLLLFLCSFTAVFSDTLDSSSGKFEGAFESYEKGNFMFRLNSGKLIKKPRMAVKKLAIENPREASFTRSARGKSEAYTLKGYEKGKFLISKNGKDAGLMAMHISSISISAFAPPSSASSRRQSSEPKIDMTILQGRDFTPAQKTIIARFQKARKAYKEFRAKSSAIVKEMDTATGMKREQLLNDLRIRKNDEQPIKNTYNSSRSDLLKEFPELLEPKAAPVQEGGVTEITTQTEIVITIPKLEDGQVLFLDTTILNQAGALTDAKSAAINSYNTAKKEYETKVNQPDADRTSLSNNLLEAQKNLFKAFPNLKVVEE